MSWKRIADPRTFIGGRRLFRYRPYKAGQHIHYWSGSLFVCGKTSHLFEQDAIKKYGSLSIHARTSSNRRSMSGSISIVSKDS